MEPSFPSTFGWEDQEAENTYRLGPGLTFADSAIPPARQPDYDLFVWEVECLEISRSEQSPQQGQPLVCVGLASIDGTSSTQPGNQQSGRNGGCTIAVLPGDATLPGAVAYFSNGILRTSPPRSFTEQSSPAAASQQPYGLPYTASDRIACGWSPHQGILWFAHNELIQGRVPTALYGPPAFWYPVIGVENAKVTVRVRFALGFAAPRSLNLQQEEGGWGLSGIFKWETLWRNAAVDQMCEDVERRYAVSPENVRAFLEGQSSDDVTFLSEEHQQTKLKVSVGLLEHLVETWEEQRPSADSRDSSPLRTGIESEEGRSYYSSTKSTSKELGAVDGYIVHTVVFRARQMQRILKRAIEEKIGDQVGGVVLVQKLQTLQRFTELFARLEATQDKESCNDLRQLGAQMASGQSPPPSSLLSLVCRVRSGSRLDKQQAALHLAQLARMDKCRPEILAAGGLPSLIHLLHNTFTEVATHAAAVITWLVLGIEDPALLLRYQSGILSALHLLVSAARCEQGCVQGPLDRPSYGWGSTSSSLNHDPNASHMDNDSLRRQPFLGTSPNHHLVPCINDQSYRRKLAVQALAHLTVILQHEWRDLATISTPDLALQLLPAALPWQNGSGTRPSSGRGSIPTPLPWAAGSGAAGTSAPTETPLLESVVGLALAVARYPLPGPSIQQRLLPMQPVQCKAGPLQAAVLAINMSGFNAAGMGGPADSGMEEKQDEFEEKGDNQATILAAFTIFQLARCECTKPLLVNRGVLPILMEWLTSPHMFLQRHAAGIIASLCSRPEPTCQSRSNRSGALPDLMDAGLPSSSAVYQQGWIDAQILAEGTLVHLLPFATVADRETRSYVTSALANLSIHSQNRACLVKSGAIGTLVLLLSDATADGEEGAGIAQDALNALCHLAMDQTYEATQAGSSVGESVGKTSPCFMIAKEGGLVVLTYLLGHTASQQRSTLRVAATGTVAVMSQLTCMRVPMLNQRGLVEGLLNIGATVGKDAEGLEEERKTSARSLALPAACPLTGRTPGTTMSGEQAVSKEGGRDEGMMLSMEALHIAFTLANLAEVAAEAHEQRLLQSGAIPVLLSLCKSKHSEVVHQASRALASISRALVRGFTPSETGSAAPAGSSEEMLPLPSVIETQEEQLRLWQASDVLRLMLGLLSSSNHLSQLEALKALAVLAQITDFHAMIVQGALKELLRLAVDSQAEKARRGLAEDVLVALGWEGGVRDLEAAGNDAGLLLDWWCIEREVAEQREVWRQLGFAVQVMVRGEAGAERDHRLGSKCATRGDGTASKEAPVSKWTAGKGWVKAEEEERGSFGGVVRKLVTRDVRLRDLLANCLAPGPEGPDTEEENRYSSYGPADPLQRSTSPLSTSLSSSSSMSHRPSSSLTLAPPGQVTRISSNATHCSLRGFLSYGHKPSQDGGSMYASSISGPRNGSSKLCRTKSMNLTGPVCVPEPGCLTVHLQKMLDRYFPSPLMQREMLPLTTLGKAGVSRILKQQKNVDSQDAPYAVRALVLPSRRFFSFRREGRVISRVLKKYAAETDHWALCFQDSSFEGEFCMSLLERLSLLCKVKSLVFRSTSSTPDTALAYFVGGLPAQIRFLVFDKCLGRDALQILGVTLRTKATTSQALTIAGLSIRNHDHLRPVDFGPLLDFLQREGSNDSDNTSSTSMNMAGISASETAPGHTAKATEEDIVGNMGRGGSGAAGLDKVTEILRLGSLSKQCSSAAQPGLRYLDLHGNKLGDSGCADVINAVKHNHSLIALDLSSNQINRGVHFLEALAAFPNNVRRKSTWLETLILDDNGLNGKSVQRLLGILEEDKSLQTLSLAHNGIGEIKTMESFRRLLRRDASLTELNLSDNKVGVEGSRELLFGLLENQKLRFCRLGGNSGIKGEERALIERQLVGNRRRFYGPIGQNEVEGAGLGKVGGDSRADRGPIADSVVVPLTARSRATTLPKAALCTRTDMHENDDAKDEVLDRLSYQQQPGLHTDHDRKHAYNANGVPNGFSGRHGEPRGRIRHTHSAKDELDRDAFLPSTPHLQPQHADPTYLQTVEHHRSFSAPVPDLSLLPRSKHHNGLPSTSPPSHISPPSSSYARYGSTTSETSESSSANSFSLHSQRRECVEVLFSAPLAWRDLRGQLHPIEQIDIDQERELLIQSFGESGADVIPRFGFATTERLRTAVTLGARALHYSGHGHKEGRLTFEDGEGGLQLVGVEMLRSLCAAGEHKLELVTVSSCFSKMAGQAFAEAGVPHVVCVHVDAQIADAAALAFTRSFYLSIAVGHTVANAFEIGRQAVAASPSVPNSSVEISKFLLLPEKVDHQIAIFPAPSPHLSPTMLQASPLPVRDLSVWSQQQAHLPPPPEDFMGREVEQYMAISACLNRRLITLLGVAGVGKSSLASAVCQYMALRRKIPDGIVLVRLRGRTTLEQLVNHIVHAVDAQLGPGPHPLSTSDGTPDLEAVLFSRLRPLRFLLVLDHTEDLQAAQDGTDLKVFLRLLFDQTRFVKVMVTSSRPVDLHTLPGISAGEHLVSVGPLTFRYTVRLFSRLCPHLHTARERRLFFQSLVPPEQADVTLYSRGTTPSTIEILEQLGGGNPSRIVQRAFEVEEREVFDLMQKYGSSPKGPKDAAR